MHYKQRLTDSFSQAALTYNTAATVQKECASELFSILGSLYHQLPDGAFLELGCGTGFVTQQLIQYAGDRPLEITDISLNMLECCQKNLFLDSNQLQRISFRQLDGELVDRNKESYAVIISNFVVQWFENPIESLQTLVKALKPGGILLASFPTCQSFPEWKQICEQTGLPFTANSLPDPQFFSEQLTSDSVNCVWHETKFCTEYAHAIEFFRSLKSIGARTNRLNQTISPTQLNQLIQAWNHQYFGKIQVHYHIAFLVAQRR